HHVNLVSFVFGQLFIVHCAFSFGEKNGELYQLATFIRNCTYYPKPPINRDTLNRDDEKYFSLLKRLINKKIFSKSSMKNPQICARQGKNGRKSAVYRS
ncbi:MAG: hypothetical protein ACE1ZG_05725, partial [Gammaproteobacteria bacterium]